MTGITAGTISVTNGSAAITGSGTAWLWAGVRANSAMIIKAAAGRDWYVVGADATSDTALTLSEAYAGATESGVAYEIVPVYGTADAVDALQQIRRVVRWMQDTPGLSISGFAFVDDIAGRAAYDAEAEDFAVVVRDCTGVTGGADRTAIFHMGDAGSADWSEPAWISGPVGATGPAGDGYFTVALSDLVSPLVVGQLEALRMPFAFTLTGVRASLLTAQTSGDILTLDIKEGGVSILSTPITIDNDEKTSTTADAAAVISDASLADDAEITFHLDQIGTGARGLKVTLLGQAT